jgi:hypothetical protein
MSNKASFYLPDDVIDIISEAGNGSAYITELVRRDAHCRQGQVAQSGGWHSEPDRSAARLWAVEQVATMKRRPADYSQVREALGIAKAV